MILVRFIPKIVSKARGGEGFAWRQAFEEETAQYRAHPRSRRIAHGFDLAAQQPNRISLASYSHHISRQIGCEVAVFAAARKLATLIYRLLRWGQAYLDEGDEAYERRSE